MYGGDDVGMHNNVVKCSRQRTGEAAMLIALPVVAFGTQFWVLPRRRRGGVICFVAVFLLTVLFRFVFCTGYGGDDDGIGTTVSRNSK